MKTAIWKAAVILGIGAFICIMPVPEGVKPQAWQLFALFVSTIVAFILQPLPIGALAFMSLTVAIITKVLKPAEALSGFSDSTIWLIVSAFLFAKSFIKTGLGKRIAFLLIEKMGKNTLSLAYTIVLTDLIIAPATPSNAARAGGVIYPIVRSLASAFHSEPQDHPRRVGSYLMQVEYQGNTVTSAMFMTSMAGNPLAALLAAQAAGLEISWGLWALAALVPGILALLVIPYYLYKVYPPELKKTPEAKAIAQQELKQMGPMTLHERIVAVIFVVALLLWSTAQYTGVHATAVAMLGVSAMLITNILTWKDVMEERGAWDTLIWMGALVGLAGQLAKSGFIAWFSTTVGSLLAGIPWLWAFLILLVVYTYAHYGFASLTAHITAMYSAFLAVAIAAGTPAYLAALGLAYMSNLCMSITHYAASPAPIYYGAGYVSQGAWWSLGFQVSVINMIIWLGVGSMWWKFLGLW